MEPYQLKEKFIHKNNIAWSILYKIIFIMILSLFFIYQTFYQNYSKLDAYSGFILFAIIYTIISISYDYHNFKMIDAIYDVIYESNNSVIDESNNCEYDGYSQTEITDYYESEKIE